jgi:hypothetical protein
VARRQRGQPGIVHLSLDRLSDGDMARMVRACVSGAGAELVGRVQAAAEGVILARLPHAEPAALRALWPLILATLADRRAPQAIEEARRLGVGAFDLNRGLIGYAEAVLAGRAGQPQRADDHYVGPPGGGAGRDLLRTARIRRSRPWRALAELVHPGEMPTAGSGTASGQWADQDAGQEPPRVRRAAPSATVVVVALMDAAYQQEQTAGPPCEHGTD